MQQIKIEKDKLLNSGKSSSQFLQYAKSGRFFNEFVDSQKVGYMNKDGSVKRKGITAEGAINLRTETTHILNHCNPHDSVSLPETTHLVVGYVQSGKTMSFIGLTALALDNGYRVIIYLAGTKKNLLDQTSFRLEKDLIKQTSNNRDYYKIHKDPTENDANDIVGHLKLSAKPIILIPILKHYEHINRLTKIFENNELRNILDNETVIIVDDEADQASLNSFGRKNSMRDDEDEDKISSTYAAILKLRTTLPGNTYVQYTATPQANILISIQDILSPKSHTLLTPGEGYVGGKLFFGKGNKHELFNGGLILTIPTDQVLDKRRNKLKEIPQSLKDALILHVLAIAIVVKFLRIEDVNFLSMMVHVDNTKSWNKIFKQWIDKELKNWSIALDKPDGQDDKEYLLSRFKQLFPRAIEYYTEEDNITFDKIKPYISDIINDKKVYLVNTDIDAETTIRWDDFLMHILVGAEMLNRGFTVENLATTYMPRYSTSTTNADTIQQRCRFFGYKVDYIKSCRVFLPKQSIIHYLDYVDHEEELRTTLKECDSLEVAERKLLLSENLRPTRLNVLPISVVRSKLVGISSMKAYDNAKTIENNNNTVNNFLKIHSSKLNDILYGENELSNKHRGFKLPIEDAINFLSDFQFRNLSDAMRKAATIRYLRYLSNIDVESLKYVYFIQMAYQMETHSDGIRKRQLNTDTFNLSSTLLQGQSSNYKGDSAMVGQDSITLQLHHIQFKNAFLPLGFPRQAYTLAINYPDSLAATYYASEASNQDDK